MARGHREVDVVDETIAQGKEIPLSDLEGKGATRVSEAFVTDDLEQLKFANEILTIIVHQDTSEGSLDVISPSVNGINQPIIRGVQSKVKRKYVEALARCRTETFTQRQSVHELDKITMVPRAVVSYPFSVIHDPNPKGRPWLEGILREA